MNLPDFSKIFHQSSKDHSKGHPPIPADDEEWPEEWKTTSYKAYPRLPKVELDNEALAEEGANLFNVVARRQSRRDFRRALSLSESSHCF